MSWKFVFNTNQKFIAGSNVSELIRFVKTTGYNFFTFNGIVYDLQGQNTGITVDDLF